MNLCLEIWRDLILSRHVSLLLGELYIFFLFVKLRILLGFGNVESLMGLVSKILEHLDFPSSLSDTVTDLGLEI